MTVPDPKLSKRGRQASGSSPEPDWTSSSTSLPAMAPKDGRAAGPAVKTTREERAWVRRVVLAEAA